MEKKLRNPLDKPFEVWYYKDTKRDKEIKKMVALMKYECGLKFTGCVFEDMETAKKWLEYKNPAAYELIPVAFYTKNGEIK